MKSPICDHFQSEKKKKAVAFHMAQSNMKVTNVPVTESPEATKLYRKILLKDVYW